MRHSKEHEIRSIIEGIEQMKKCKKHWPHLMQAFLNTCSDLHMKKTAIWYLENNFSMNINICPYTFSNTYDPYLR